MNTPTVWCVGPHQYKLQVVSVIDERDDGTWRDELWVDYNLFGLNGYTVTPRPGVPNEHGWKTASRSFPCTVQGRRDAILYADSLLRPQDREND